MPNSSCAVHVIVIGDEYVYVYGYEYGYMDRDVIRITGTSKCDFRLSLTPESSFAYAVFIHLCDLCASARFFSSVFDRHGSAAVSAVRNIRLFEFSFSRQAARIAKESFYSGRPFTVRVIPSFIIASPKGSRDRSSATQGEAA